MNSFTKIEMDEYLLGLVKYNAPNIILVLPKIPNNRINVIFTKDESVNKMANK